MCFGTFAPIVSSFVCTASFAPLIECVTEMIESSEAVFLILMCGNRGV